MDKYLGKRLDGRYEIREILGVGGMAVVYKAYDNVEDRIVAIKILREEFAKNEEFLRRFKNESRAISLLSHPNIVKIFDVSFGDLIQYIVMEHIEGITLKEYIEREGSLSWKQAVHFTVQILRGLQHAHDRGIVHRDVKPQNIMVLADGTIKVTDFGIARFSRSEQRTITDKAIGSVHYISPEQARGDITDEKADIYSVGVMLYEMLTGQLPFQADNAVSVAIMQLQREPTMPTELNGSIPLGVEQITMHAMQKDTAHRYKSSSEMLCDLEAFKKDPAITFDYTYFVDDSPTRFIEPEKTEEPVQVEVKSKFLPILAGVAATFFVAIVAVLIFVARGFLSHTGDEFACPNFIGQNYETVSKDKEVNEKFKDIIFKWNYNSKYDYGHIYEQSKAPKKKLKEGSETIVLYVSMGEELKTVPDVRGDTQINAKKILEMQGFKVEIKEQSDEDIAAGLAVGTSPAANKGAPEGSKVTLFVSTGPAKVFVNLPNLVGLKLEDAKKLITKSGLVVGEITYVDNYTDQTVPKGTVMSQDPKHEKDKQVGKSSKVNLTVSSGERAYKNDVTVNLPKDVTQVSLWIDGQVYKESEKLTDSPQKFTFKGVASKKKEITAIVKVKTSKGLDYAEYQHIKIDLTTGKVTVTKTLTIS
ncbi:MAG: Stk1 family PASTA domain-containing Ser/Thr kinase [Ruminococcaceae bacterium]|nr:Stk1 family PASTA domain-containing Ser/Thr kinase [Oscillospiraceae bacterium]